MATGTTRCIRNRSSNFRAGPKCLNIASPGFSNSRIDLSTTAPMSTPTDQPDVQNKRFTPLGKEDVAAATASTLIVVDNGSTIANKLADIVMGTGPDRSAQRN